MTLGVIAQGAQPTDHFWTVMGTMAAIAVVMVLLLGWAWRSAYTKPSADAAFVRTGMGGVRVFIDHAGLVYGWFHFIKWVSLETIKISVARTGPESLWDSDGVNLDVSLDLFVRVPPHEEAVLRAARSMGEKSLSAKWVSDLLGSKVAGAARQVLAERTFEEARKDPERLEDQIQDALAEDMAQSGLAIEGCAITGLRKTP